VSGEPSGAGHQGEAHGAGAEHAGPAEHGSAVHGTADHLVKMANDIGNYFRAEPVHEEAVAGIANHIARYWTKRMREKIAVHLQQQGDADLDELPREALRRLMGQQAPVQQPAAKSAAK
jgi:formate dehydrogenase subunit delta